MRGRILQPGSSSGGGGGAVSSVDGQTGDVDLSGSYLAKANFAITAPLQEGQQLAVSDGKIKNVYVQPETAIAPPSGTSNMYNLLFAANDDGDVAMTNGIATDAAGRLNMQSNFIMNSVIDGGNLDIL